MHGLPVGTWLHFGPVPERAAGSGRARHRCAHWRDDPVFFLKDKAMPVMREGIVCDVAALMGGGEETDERRRMVKEYMEKAHEAMEKWGGGSSYEHVTRFFF